jgi:hypothetical protein
MAALMRFVRKPHLKLTLKLNTNTEFFTPFLVDSSIAFVLLETI